MKPETLRNGTNVAVCRWLKEERQKEEKKECMGKTLFPSSCVVTLADVRCRKSSRKKIRSAKKKRRRRLRKKLLLLQAMAMLAVTWTIGVHLQLLARRRRAKREQSLTRLHLLRNPKPLTLEPVHPQMLMQRTNGAVGRLVRRRKAKRERYVIHLILYVRLRFHLDPDDNYAHQDSVTSEPNYSQRLR